MSVQWSYECDVLVVGSGAGALTAAVRARDLGHSVLVIEKTGQYGGTSAMSGGVLWLPNSPLIPSAGGSENTEDARGYLKAVVDDPALDTRIDAFIDAIPGFIEFLHAHTHVRLAVLPQFPDMYPDTPGFSMFRCHESLPFHGRVLPPEELLGMRAQHPQTALFGTIGWTPSESLVLQARGPGWLQVAVSMVARYLLDLPWRFRSVRDRRLVLGGALVGALRRSMLDRGMPLWLNAAFEEYVLEGERVAGAVVMRDGARLAVRARKAVILASGGFEKNAAMRAEHLASPTAAEWTAGSPGNTGEVITTTARQLGVPTAYMNEAWWGPTFLVPGEPQARMLIIEKNLPGAIMVNRQGKRFVNESSSYTKVIRGMVAANKPGAESVPAYMIFDARFRQRFPIGPMLPSTFQPDFMVPRAVREAIPSAGDVRTLAQRLGVDPAGLAATVEAFNAQARAGKDTDFQRGDATYDRYYGMAHEHPNPCLGPIEQAPFYGVKVYPGDLGTKGGVAVDAAARVLNAAGEPIPGLYAIGNCSAPVTGATYPASGSTLAPAMVFGYVAANHIGPA